MTTENPPVPGEEWAKLSPDLQAATSILACNGCGRTMPGPNGTPNDISPSLHCNECPPWQCEDCGETADSENLCRCWTRLDQMAFADVKALFAADGTFNVSADRQVTVADG